MQFSLATGYYFINLACDDALFDKQVISSIVDFYSKTNYPFCTDKGEKSKGRK